MSGYKVEEDDETYFIDSNGREITHYWLMYSDKQRKRMKTVHKQMISIWYEIERTMRVLINHGVETDELMKRVSKLYLCELRVSKQQQNDLIQRKKEAKNLKKRLDKIRNKKIPV